MTFCVIVWQTTQAADYAAQGWTGQKDIVINTASNAANVTGNVYNFPILVRLNSSNFTFSQAQTSGSDIRFAKTDKTTLLYQIERWDATLQQADIWVKLDTVYGNSSKTIVMFYGKSGVTSESAPQTVFDTANGFTGVWHMADTTDATKNINKTTMSPSPYVPTCTTGIVGNSYYFNGADNYMDVANSSTLDMAANFTVSFWAKWESGANPGFQRIVCRKSVWNAIEGWDIDMEATQPSGLSVLAAGKTGGGVLGFGPNNVASEDWSIGNWHHVAVTYKEDSLLVYGEGVLKAATLMRPTVIRVKGRDCVWEPILEDSLCTDLYDTTFGDTSYKPIDNDLPIRFGADQETGGSVFMGRLDEIRLDRRVRSADWVKLCYENQKAEQTLVNVGGQISILQPAYNKTFSDFRMNLQGNMQVLVYDMRGRAIINRQINSSNAGTTIESILRKQGITGSGVYQVQIRSLDNAMRTIIFERKMMLVP